MEVAVAKALKPSLQTEFVFSQGICDDILCLNANNVVVGEDFSVDDLLDFSNGKEIDDDDEEEEEEEKGSTTSGSEQDRTEEDINSNSTAAGDSDSIFAGELAVPADDVADLEWVSHFVDDSLPELSLLYPVRPEQTRARAEPEARPGLARAPFPFRTKPRTTRTRKPISHVWSFNHALSLPSSCCSLFSPTAPPLPFASKGFGKPPAKKQKRKPETQAHAHTGGPQFQRRCSHCQVQKTPQWRTGPLGPKTLCNACGVRFKSGRLFPEYRPACSPTFSGDVHSNSHRKVLEMRRRKEMAEPVPGLDQAQMVASF